MVHNKNNKVAKCCPKCSSKNIETIEQCATKDKTIRRWLQAVGPHWQDLITLRCADRKGNFAKKDKPMITSKMQELMDKVQKMIDDKVPLFREDLEIDGEDLIEMGIKPGPKFKEIFSNILGIVVSDPEKNSRAWLLDFVKKTYVEKNDEEKHS